MKGIDISGINVLGSNAVNDSDVIKEPVGFNIGNKSQKYPSLTSRLKLMSSRYQK
jgi:hypothetical protein